MRMLSRCTLLFLLCAMPAMAAPELPRFGFENGIEGWISGSTAGAVLVAATPQRVRTGKFALEYRYTTKRSDQPGQKPTEFAAVITPLTTLEGMASLSLDVRTDSPTLLLVALGEEGGARYEYVTATPEEGWLHLEIDRSEFVRSDDSTDANNRLDPDQVRNLAVADLRAVISTMDNPMVKLLGERTGEHAFWLDNVAFSADPVAPAPPAGQVIIDDFRRENIPWIPLAGVSVQVGPAPGGGDGRALRVAYTSGPGKLSAVIHNVIPGRLARVDKSTFRAASKLAASLAVAVEETGGARYLAIKVLPAGEAPRTITADYSDFRLSDDTKDDNGRLDIGKVKSIAFVDLAGLTGTPEGGSNVLWLQDIRAFLGAGGLESR